MGEARYTVDGKNVVIIQGFKEYCALGFFQGALLKDPKKLLVQLGQVQAARVMKFTSAKEIATKAATIKAYVREAMAAEKAGLKIETKPPEFPVPEELKEKFRNDPRFKRAFEALTPGGKGDTCFTLPARSSRRRGPRGSRRRCLRSSKDEGSWSGDRSWWRRRPLSRSIFEFSS